MKKLLFSACLLAGFGVFAQQQNTIPQNGNVGIGTTNPSAKLDVNGSAVFDSTVVMKDSLEIQKSLRVKDKMKVDKKAVFKKNVVIKENARIEGNLRALSNVKFEGLPDVDSLSTQSVLVLGDDDKVYRVNVGVLNYGPYQPINCKYDQLGDFIPQNPTWTSEPEKLHTGTEECTGFVRVGIGTATPDSRLEVKTFANSSGNGVPGITVNSAGSGGGDQFKVDAAGHIVLTADNTNNPTPLLIQDQTDKKVFQVDSKGFIRARRIRIDTEVWPDYVFEEGYVLMPLEDVEQFIQENGHLPNVPAAEEVTENGQDLSEMNKKLMEKVEELTLHLIDQNKRLKELEKQLEEVQSKK